MWKRVSVFFITTFCWSYVLSDDCATPQGKSSFCVSIYDCPDLLAAFKQRPLPSSVVSYLQRSQCGFDGNTPMVCCGPLPQQETTQRVPTPSTSRPYVSSNPGDDEYSSEDSLPASRNDCGVDSNGDRIYGGQLTDLDEFPWMTLLGYLTRSNTLTFQCGGVMINRRFVLTAAHCLIGEIERAVGVLEVVRLGEYDTQSEVDCLRGTCADRPQEIRVASKHPHPGYNDKSKSRRNDIGIVRLARRAVFTYYVQPICLPNSKERLIPGNQAYVAGWGKTLNGTNSNVKLKLSLPIFNKQQCVSKYRQLGAELWDKQICAGGVFAEDSCRGDSGDPLMQQRPEGSWEVIGIVSFGYDCGRDGWPGVYTSVFGYLDWITSTLQSTNV